jgi:drug/metabolite transporter (DMT)-like permease
MALTTVYLVWGSTYLAIRVAVRTIPPFLMAGVRFLIAGAVLYAWSIRRGDVENDPIGPRQWAAAALIGGLLLLGGNGGVVWAERRVASGLTALLIALVPIWMALMVSARGQEAVRVRALAGLLLGLGGTVLLVRSSETSGGAVSLAGVVVLVFASISWALGSVLSPTVGLPKRPMVSTAMEMLCGGAMLSLAGLFSGEATHVHASRIAGTSVVAFLYLIVFGSWAGFTAYVWLLQNAPPSLASTYAYVNPVVAVFLGWLILHERVTALTLVSAALIVGAVALIIVSQSPQARRSPESAPRSGPPPPEPTQAESPAG